MLCPVSNLYMCVYSQHTLIISLQSCIVCVCSHYICIQILFLFKTVEFGGWEGFFGCCCWGCAWFWNESKNPGKKGKSFWRGAVAEPKENQLAGCTSGLWVLPVLGLGKKLEASFCSFFSDPVHMEEKSMGAKPEKRRASVSFGMLLKRLWSEARDAHYSCP